MDWSGVSFRFFFSKIDPPLTKMVTNLKAIDEFWLEYGLVWSVISLFHQKIDPTLIKMVTNLKAIDAVVKT